MPSIKTICVHVQSVPLNSHNTFTGDIGFPWC